MLKILLPETEFFNENTSTFIKVPYKELHLSHSLYTISKWEAKTKKPFLQGDKTESEIYLYIKCMCEEPITDLDINRMSRKDIEAINSYIGDPMTATTIQRPKTTGTDRSVITSEILYYNMIALNIPFECQYWHLNRLLTLINVCDIKSNPNKSKKSTRETLQDYKALNQARKKALHTTG